MTEQEENILLLFRETARKLLHETPKTNNAYAMELMAMVYRYKEIKKEKPTCRDLLTRS